MVILQFTKTIMECIPKRRYYVASSKDNRALLSYNSYSQMFALRSIRECNLLLVVAKNIHTSYNDIQAYSGVQARVPSKCTKLCLLSVIQDLISTPHLRQVPARRTGEFLKRSEYPGNPWVFLAILYPAVWSNEAFRPRCKKPSIRIDDF